MEVRATRPLRVLFVDHAQALGGAEYSLLLLLQHLDRQRIEPILACNPGPLGQAARDLPVRVEELPLARLRGEWSSPWRLLQGARLLAQLIRREQVDVVQSNVMRASFYAALAARWTRRPLVWHVRDIFTPGLYVRFMAHFSAAAIPISQASAAPLPAWLPSEIVPNGVDLAALDARRGSRDAVRAEWGVAPDAPLVGLVGSLRRWKGHADFIRAMAVVGERHPQARFVLVGGEIFGADPSYRRELRDLARSLHPRDRLLFAGQRDDMGAVLAALDVLVHCSTAPEPFGRVMIEGMAAGLPVAAYAHGGALEIVAPGETGVLTPPCDPAALGQAVAALLDDPARARALGRAGRRRVEQEYDVRPLTRRVEAILERAAQSKPASSS